MELHIKSEFDCVYLINGVFSERAECLTMSEYDVVYITALPLKHTLLPYTVKLCGAEPYTSELASGVRLDNDHYVLSLAPRYVIVYGNAQALPPPSTPIARFFSLVKNGDLTAAYAMLSETLRASVQKSALPAFFEGYDRIVECTWDDGNKFYLIDKNGAAKLHSYTLRDEFIDDIIEPD